MAYPKTRLRRLRMNPQLRSSLVETTVTARSLITPLFVRPGKNQRIPIASMPGQYQLSIDELLKEVEHLERLGLSSVLLFGIPEKKDPLGSQAYASRGIIQQTIRSLRKSFPELLVITDLCFCEYTSHGHCGILKPVSKRASEGLPQARFDVDNDATLKIIAKTALAQAEAGADLIAPSGMMDGMVKTIRQALDHHGFQDLPVMSYAAKYASSFYGPFREAAESAPKIGNRRSYQMNPPNAQEALREVGLDLEEGADIVMVKPALAYLDIIRRVKDTYHVPVAAYNVSGEYAMVKAASEKGWIDGKQMVQEILTGIRRAGADLIITYHAKEWAERGLAPKRAVTFRVPDPSPLPWTGVRPHKRSDPSR